jgi:hypothetical protein
VLEELLENEEKIAVLFGKGLRIDSLLSFKSQAEDIVGVELDELIDYIINIYTLRNSETIILREDKVCHWND